MRMKCIMYRWYLAFDSMELMVERVDTTVADCQPYVSEVALDYVFDEPHLRCFILSATLITTQMLKFFTVSPPNHLCHAPSWVCRRVSATASNCLMEMPANNHYRPEHDIPKFEYLDYGVASLAVGVCPEWPVQYAFALRRCHWQSHRIEAGIALDNLSTFSCAMASNMVWPNRTFSTSLVLIFFPITFLLFGD